MKPKRKTESCRKQPFNQRSPARGEDRKGDIVSGSSAYSRSAASKAPQRLQKAAEGQGRKVFISPWRIEYILGPKDKGCFLCQACQIPEGDEAAWKKALLLHRGPHGLVMMNRYPYTGGHLLIAPRRHTADLPGLAREESAYLWEYSRLAVDIIARVTQAQGYNLGMNLGRAAGSGVEEHLHMHALPRWNGDTNFLHIIADTATVPVALEALWDKMRPLFRILDF